jgi:hypothetical protein
MTCREWRICHVIWPHYHAVCHPSYAVNMSKLVTNSKQRISETGCTLESLCFMEFADKLLYNINATLCMAIG